jgi:hypothetical protein
MRTSLALAAAAALFAGVVGTATPAAAICDPSAGCSGVTFTIAAGTISIVAPAAGGTATTTSNGGGVDVAVPLTGTVVTDSRIGSSGWSVNATVTDFSTTGGTVAKGQASFTVPAAPTSVVGCSSFPVRATSAVGVNSTTGTTTAPILSCTALGTSAATFTPVLTVAVPGGSIAGTYTGTVTQSAS